MSSHSLTRGPVLFIPILLPARFISLQSHPCYAQLTVSRSYPMFRLFQVNSCPCSALQSSLFWAQQLCLGPHLSFTQIFINSCLLCSHRPYSIQCHSCTLWEHNAEELGCFCLNLSWASFFNFSELLICGAGPSVLPLSNIATWRVISTLGCYSLHASFHQFSLLCSIKQLSWVCHATHYLLFLLFNQLPPSLCQG